VYSAGFDGWNAADFHRCVKKRAPLLGLCEVLETGFVFGFCVSESFHPPSKAKASQVALDEGDFAWIFSLTNGHGRAVRMRCCDPEWAMWLVSEQEQLSSTMLTDIEV
jgi:hypothetical protein